MGIFDVPSSELIKRTAEELKKVEVIQAPDWAPFVKTGVHKECPPVDQDWWYMRTASVLRKIAVLGPVGVSKLRRKYGGRKNRGHKPEHFYRGSGNIIRKALQQLEKAEFAVKAKKGVHKGRVLAPKGHALLDKVATQIMKELNITFPKKPETKFAVKKKVKKKKTASKTSKRKSADEKTKVKKPRKKRASKKKKPLKNQDTDTSPHKDIKTELKTETKAAPAVEAPKPEAKAPVTEAKPVDTAPAAVEEKTEKVKENKTE